MPVHDWKRVQAGIFHHFHHSWIEELQRALNRGLLPPEYYAMAEQRTGRFGPDVLALELDRVAVRHVSGDVVVAMIEIVSPGNKSAPVAVREFAEKAAGLIAAGVHFLIADVHPPTSACPESMHAVIWNDLQGGPGEPLDRPLVLASYEASDAPRAFLEPFAVGDALPEMPLFLKPGGHVTVPMETTYIAAFDAMPKRWRAILARSQ